MRQKSAGTPHAALSQEDLDQLVQRVQHQLKGRLRDFDLKHRGNGVVLTGRVPTYYAKQLAQHAVMRATVLPILGNDIEVS
jgi:hypothetical protein